MDDMSDAEDESEAQVNDWRFSELRTTDLAAWMSPPLSGCQSSLMRIGKGSAPHPPSMAPNVSKMRGMTQPLLIGLPLRGSCEPKHPTKQRLNSFWFRMYCHGTPKDPDPSALRAAVTSFPFQYKDEGVVQYRQIQKAVRVMWLAAQTSMTRYMRIPIPDGIPEWGVDEQELPPMQVMPSRTAGKRSHTTSAGHRSRRPDWDGSWQ